MSLFDAPVTLQFRPDEAEIVTRPIHGDGGAQMLLRELLKDYANGRLVLEVAQLDKCAVYAYRYGGGGFQERFRLILRAARRAGWQQVAEVERAETVKGQWNG